MGVLKIKDWAKEDVPSNKLMTLGSSSLTDVELISLIFWSGTKGKSALDIAREMYDNSDRSLCKLVSEIEENGEAKNIQLLAAFELGRRKAKEEEINRLNANVINNSRAIFVQFNQELSDLDHEECWALYLSLGGKILCKKRISEGGVQGTITDIRQIVKPAISYNASFVCLCHNHPHSTTRPSKPDIDMTNATKNALELFGVRLLDHIIISDGRYYSFADNGDI